MNITHIDDDDEEHADCMESHEDLLFDGIEVPGTGVSTQSLDEWVRLVSTSGAATWVAVPNVLLGRQVHVR